jgi:hypothetical protein
MYAHVFVDLNARPGFGDERVRVLVINGRLSEPMPGIGSVRAFRATQGT